MKATSGSTPANFPEEIKRSEPACPRRNHHAVKTLGWMVAHRPPREELGVVCVVGRGEQRNARKGMMSSLKDEDDTATVKRRTAWLKGAPGTQKLSWRAPPIMWRSWGKVD